MTNDVDRYGHSRRLFGPSVASLWGWMASWLALIELNETELNRNKSMYTWTFSRCDSFNSPRGPCSEASLVRKNSLSLMIKLFSWQVTDLFFTVEMFEPPTRFHFKSAGWELVGELKRRCWGTLCALITLIPILSSIYLSWLVSTVNILSCLLSKRKILLWTRKKCYIFISFVSWLWWRERDSDAGGGRQVASNPNWIFSSRTIRVNYLVQTLVESKGS